VIRHENGLVWYGDDDFRMANISEYRANRFWGVSWERRFNYLHHRYFKYRGGEITLAEDDVVINFGANVGELCVMANVLPALAANAALFDFSVVPVAVWREPGLLQMYVNSGSADTSVFNKAEETTLVSAKTIDEICENIPHVRLIIGDAEGAEPEALMGAKETLKKTDWVSVCASAERDGADTSTWCAEILEENGFKILRQDKHKFFQLMGRRK
jgi:FkbM family methyltransferase